MQFILICLVAFIGAAILSRLARDIWILMVNPPTYYEGRDWFDDDRIDDDQMTDDPFDEIPVYRLDRIEEDFEE